MEQRVITYWLGNREMGKEYKHTLELITNSETNTLPHPKIMSLVDSLATSIATMEGWFAPTSNRAQVNNNPGNLRSGVGMTGTDSHGLAVFASPADGWNALYHQIGLDAGRGLTLSSFVSKYAPPTENDTSNYLQFVSSKTGVSPDTTLASLFGAPTNVVSSGSDPSTTGSSTGFVASLDAGASELANSVSTDLFSSGGGSDSSGINGTVVGIVALAGVLLWKLI